MATVGSATRVDGVDLQMMVSAATAFARPQTSGAHGAPDTEADAQISASGKLRSATSAVLDAAQRLNKAPTWQATKATSSNEALVQAVSNKAAPGDYEVNVDAVALAQTTSSATFSSLSTVVGIGTLNLQLGTWNTSTSTFATNPNWPKASVTFGPKDTSLEHIRDKINAAGVGVIALVMTDATGSRLVLRSTTTGEANGFKASVEPGENVNAEAAQALASMGLNPSSIEEGAGALNQAAQDASLRIDGRQIQSPRNLIEDEVSGLSLRLNGGQQRGSATIHVEADTQSMAHDIQSFAQAYNDMVNQLAASDTATLDSSSTREASALQQSIEEAFRPTPNGDTLGQSLQDAGIRMLANGQMEVNTTELSQALRDNPAKVERLFTAQEGNGSPSGLAARLLQRTGAEANANDQPAAPAQPPQAIAAEPATTAGALYRQRLLEQYAQSSKHEDEAAMSANEA